MALLPRLALLFKGLAGPTRLELATSGLTARRSDQTELRPHGSGRGTRRTRHAATAVDGGLGRLCSPTGTAPATAQVCSRGRIRKNKPL